MARKRMIDPGIWTSSSFMSLTDRQQLLFIGLFSNADDYGKITGDTVSLKALIFPNKSPAIIKSLDEQLATIEDSGMIFRYEVKDKSYIWLVKWERIQKMNYRSISRIPNPEPEELKGFSEDLKVRIDKSLFSSE